MHKIVIAILFSFIALCAAWAQNFLKVTGPCNHSFPEDHGPHPDYRTEWWYYTGNLSGADGRRFGFQLTFFRTGLAPPSERAKWPEPASPWRSDEIYLAHAALTDISGGRHLQAEKVARPVLSMAGAEMDDGVWRIYLNTWQTVIGPNAHSLQAQTDDFALALELSPSKPPVLHGDAGYSRKGEEPERASCYYSFTRLTAGGTVTMDGRRIPVTGSAWMDHEFSTDLLQPGITGWDWFSLQLSDHTEIMIFFLRQTDGSLNAATSGTYVLPSGKARHLRAEDLRIEPLDFWTSPHTGVRYPIRWRLFVDSLASELVITAQLADQEMRTPRSTNIVYWEGSVALHGTKAGAPVEGVGYVELTGYAEPFDAPL
jgi:predicted secreted hydrolase